VVRTWKIFILASILSLGLTPISVAGSNPKSGSACPKINQSINANGMKYTCVKLGKKNVWDKGNPIQVSSPTPTSSSYVYPDGFSGLKGISPNYAYRDANGDLPCHVDNAGVCATIEIYSALACDNTQIIVDFNSSNGTRLDSQSTTFFVGENNTMLIQLKTHASTAKSFYIRSIKCNDSSAPNPSQVEQDSLAPASQSSATQGIPNQIMYSFPTNVLGRSNILLHFTMYSTNGAPVSADFSSGSPCRFDYTGRFLIANNVGVCNLTLSADGASDVRMNIKVYSTLNMSTPEIEDRSRKCTLITNLPLPSNCSR
jgi:hypothetical protein